MPRIIQLSDIHFSKGNQPLFNQVDAKANFMKLIPEISKLQPDLLFLTGDLSQDGSIESYRELQTELAKLNYPKYLIPGNHDNKENFNYLLASVNNYQVEYIDIAGIRFIFVDSCVENSSSGFISQASLARVTELITGSELNNVLIMHHQFLAVNILADRYMITNAEEVIAFIQQYSLHLKAIFHGHVHNSYQLYIPNTNINSYACPATCLQFDLAQELIINFNIGFRVIDIENGQINTFAHLIQNATHD